MLVTVYVKHTHTHSCTLYLSKASLSDDFKKIQVGDFCRLLFRLSEVYPLSCVALGNLWLRLFIDWFIVVDGNDASLVVDGQKLASWPPVQYLGDLQTQSRQ